jgi:release factor glutamine methyltransferase
VTPPSTTPEQAWTLGKLLDWTIPFLRQKGSEFPRLDTEVLLAHAQGCRRIELYTRHEEIATEAVRTRFRELIRRRVEGCPVAYLVGKKEFFSLEFEVSPAVLIPRPETEMLVMTCLEAMRRIPEPVLLDVGTGSGNLVIALLKQLPRARATAVDCSAGALEIARRNAGKHGVENRIRFLQGDLLEPLVGEERFDAILSNPPYIAREDWEKLPVGVRCHEPRVALDGGPGGYEVIQRLVATAGARLRSGGYLILEIGAAQEHHVRRMIEERSGFELEPTIQDDAGHPRVLKARWK